MKEEMHDNLFQDDNDLEPSPNQSSSLSDKTKKQIRKIVDAEEAQRKRTWSFYARMKKDNPSLYWSAKTQCQIHQDAEALGQAFEDGDFNDE